MTLAEIQLPEVTSLLQFGIAGIMLAWFMFRVERRLDDHTNVISDLARSILLDVLSRESLSDPLRSEATAVMERITQRAHKK